jgi:nucleoid DNA-binding protein
MRKRHGWVLAGLLGSAALMAVLTVPAGSAKPPEPEQTFNQRLAKAAKLSEADAGKFFQALGPIVRAELAAGKQVSIPGLGTFRVVRVEEHRDLRGGRPVVVPATNTVEFLGEGQLIDSANAAGARPAESVPPFQYVPVPGQTPGQKVGPVRTNGQRIP